MVYGAVVIRSLLSSLAIIPSKCLWHAHTMAIVPSVKCHGTSSANTKIFHPAFIVMQLKYIIWQTTTFIILMQRVEKLVSSQFTTHFGCHYPSPMSINLSPRTYSISYFKALFDTLLPGYQVRLSLGPILLTHNVASYPWIIVLLSSPRVLQCYLAFQGRSTRICATFFLGLLSASPFLVARFPHALLRLSVPSLTSYI